MHNHNLTCAQAAPAWPCRGLRSAVSWVPVGYVAAQGLPCHRSPVAVSWAQGIVSWPGLPAVSRYKACLMPLPSHNILGVLQYKNSVAYPLYVTIQHCVLQYNALPSLPNPPCHNTISYIVTQLPPSLTPAAPVTIQFSYCDTLSCSQPSQPSSCNTSPRLQYNFFFSFAIHFYPLHSQKKKT